MSYNLQYKNKYEFILFNIILDELNTELLNMLSINESDINEIDDVINQINESLLIKYNTLLYNNIIIQDIFSNEFIELDDIKQIIYQFLKDAHIYDTYNIYIDFYINLLFELINQCKTHINMFLQCNIPLIRDFNKNLYHLLIISDRYFNILLEK